MKLKYILIFSVFQLIVLHSNAQTFISQKQRIDSTGVDAIYITSERKVIVDSNYFEADLPNHTILKGTFKFYKETVSKDGLKSKAYKIDGGNMFWISKDMIFFNLFETRGDAFWFFLPGCNNCYGSVEPTNAEKIAKKKLSDEKHRKSMIAIWSEMYGAFTVKCIVDKKIRPLMKEIAIPLILGQPNTINKTETANEISNQYVYNDTYVYTENGIVTVIQSKE